METLRDYQSSLVARVRDRIRDGYKRIVVQAATGAGKTHISSKMCQLAYQKGTPTLFIAHRRRLIEQKGERLMAFGVPYGVLMAGEKRRGSELIQVASRDTLLSRTCRNHWLSPPPAKLVIVDECHNAMAAEYQHLLSLYPEATIIGLTATPARSDGRGLGGYFQILECCVPTSRLIDEGHLVPVKVFAPCKEKGKRVLCGDPVAHWLKHARGRPTVAFLSRVAASLALVAAFKARGVTAEHIDSHTEDKERDKIVWRVQTGQTQVVCNVGIWTEGVDIPCLSCCILMRLSGSYVLYAQAVGRVMRAFPGKKDAVLLDHSGAVWKHGMPTDDVEWSIDEEGSVDQRRKDGEEKKPAEMKPIQCESCGLIFVGKPVCPNCGWRLPQKKKEAKRDNGLLAEVKGVKSEAMKQEELWRVWQRMLAICYHKGWTTGRASAMFRSEVGDWPTHYFHREALPHGEQWKWKVKDLYQGKY